MCTTQTKEGAVVIATALNQMFRENPLATEEARLELAELISVEVDSRDAEENVRYFFRTQACNQEGRHRFLDGGHCIRCGEPRE